MARAVTRSWKPMEDRGRVPASSDFGALLRRYRLAAGLSQEALAERAQLSLYGISALERGYRRTPQRETVALLSDALALNDKQRAEFEAAAARRRLPRTTAEASLTIGPWSSAGSSSLPLALTRFVGREAELEEITALVHDHRLVTITGAGGIGKTQTALHVAREWPATGKAGLRLWDSRRSASHHRSQRPLLAQSACKSFRIARSSRRSPRFSKPSQC